jgi:hypothetical protein
MKTNIIILFFVIIFSSCNQFKNKDKYEDDFYNSYSGSDYNRLPLIKPFEALKLKGEKYWRLNTSNNLNPIGTTSPVDSINVVGNYIFGHCLKYQDEDLKGYKTPEQWFIIDIEKNKMTFYKKDSQLYNYLKTKSIQDKLLFVDDLTKGFKENYYLPWITNIALKKEN